MSRRSPFVYSLCASSVLLLALTANTAQAARHMDGLELGAGMGYSIMQTGQKNEQHNRKDFYKNYNNMQWGLHAGYWWSLASNWQWGMQLGYQNLGGSYHRNNADLRPVHVAQVADYLLGLRYYVAPNIALQGKLGVAHQWLKLARNDEVSRQFAFNPEWQIGVLYKINSKVTTELMVERITGSAIGDKDARNPASMAILAGLNWRIWTQDHHKWHQCQHLTGLELGGSMGYSIMQTGQKNAQDTTTYVLRDYNNFAWGLHAGYWWPLTSHWQWGMQLGYQHLGDSYHLHTSTTTTTFRPVHAAQVADYLLGLRYYAAPNIALQGKLGVAHQWLRLGNNNDQSKVFALNPEWQLGILYDINPKLSTELTIDRIAGTSVGRVDARNPASMAILAGLNWHLLAQKQHSWCQHPHWVGFELGMGVGYSIMQTVQINEQDSSDHTVKDYNSLQWGLHAGYWWSLAQNWQWGMQLGYQHLGDAYHSDGADARPVHAAQVANYLLGLRYYVAPNIALHGQLGVAHQWLKLGLSNIQSKYFAFNLEWQLGVLYDINPKLSAELTIDRIIGSAVGHWDARNPGSMAILAGLNWRVLTHKQRAWHRHKHKAGLELGAGMGYSIMQTGQKNSQEHPHIILKDYANLQWGVNLGYWWSLANNWQWGMQLGYQHLGDSYAEKSNLRRPVRAAQVADYLLGLRYYAAPNIALQGKLGVAHQWLNLGLTNGTESKVFAFNPEWQLGILYVINSKLSAEFVTTRIAGSGLGLNDARNPVSTAIMFGLNWRVLS